MANRIVLVDPVTNHVQHLESVSFASLKVKERQGLEAWVLQNPEVLGESLLVITPEFARFDKSKRRLDVLALDRGGTLVVIELKLEASNSLADLQAIRYAAFCSTMQAEDLVRELAGCEGLSEEEAEAKILEFLDADTLPSLEAGPRIILAAGSINDQELMSCVLWLRTFEVDITCVELTPYKLPDTEQIMLVPRVIIPLPEARDYIVSVEKKEAVQRRDEADRRSNEALWRAIAQSFNEFGMPFQARSTKAGGYSQIRFGDSNVHYEWELAKSRNALGVSLDFENAELEHNLRLLELVSVASGAVSEGLPWEFEAGPWGKRWARARFLLPYEANTKPSNIAADAAAAMKTLIERTWPLIREQVKVRDDLKVLPEGT
jgi:hypothetical protein